MSANPSTSAAGAKWVWRAAGTPPPAPTASKPADHRPKAVIQAAVMASVGAFIFWKFPGHRLGSYLIWTLGSVVLVSGLFIPPVFKAIDRFFFAVLPKWVATGLNWLLLVPFFYLVFLPARVFLTLSGKDPMTRRVPTDLKSYWIPRKPVPDLAQYKKQH